MPNNVSEAGQPNGQLVPIPINQPGNLGLNLQAQNAVQSPQYCIEALNCVIDQNGRVAARGAFTTVSTGGNASGQVRSIFEYKTAAGTSTPIIGFDGGISSSLVNPSGSSLVGTITSVASGRWYFQNFLGNCVGFIAGQKPIVMTSPAGTFSNIVEASGSAPAGGVGCCAFGRVWGMAADGVTLQWCALGDYTNWAAGDAGSINLSHVWPLGVDTVTAIAPFGNRLVIFGTKQILMYGSADATVLGLDVTQLQIVDAVLGAGCISQWTVALVGGETEQSDIMFCSGAGIQSLQRLVLISGDHPIQQYSKKVRDTVIQQLSAETAANVSGFYSQANGFYALCLPVSGYTWIADQRHLFQDEDGDLVARMTRWAVAPFAATAFSNGNVYVSSCAPSPGTVGGIQQYNSPSSTGTDDGTTFTVTLQLPWLDLGQDLAARMKMLKRVGGIISALNSVIIQFTWYVDFSGSGQTGTVTSSAGVDSQFNVSQFGIDQFGGGAALNIFNVNANGTGQYFSLAVSTSADSTFAIQQLNLLAKVGRLA